MRSMSSRVGSVEIANAGATRPPRSKLMSGEHRIVPLANSDRLDQTFEHERILRDKCLRRGARSEDRHVAAVCEWAYPDHVAPCDERVDDGFMPRIDGHDLIHRRSRRF